MSFLDKTYKLDRHENFRELMEGIGVPEDEINVLLNFKSSYSLKTEGDYYIKSTSTEEANKVFKFKDGVKFDDAVGPGVPGKFIFNVEGNVVTQSEMFDGVSITSRREFFGDKLVIVISTNKGSAVARKYFTAV